jgi:putative Ca2+/H+ antiporter (TMEM165/GDT1 family)
MNHYKRQMATYIAFPIVLIALVIIRSEATGANIIWVEWASHFSWGIAFISFGIWMIYTDRQERKEKATTGELLVLKDSFLRRIDSTLGVSFMIGGVLWVLLIAYSLLKTPGLLNG